ncbi:MAG: sigma-70 family RNA polymerase sigma factor [Lachnospiraceae bacterium]|nr:sigma-70 family RNA polymerase sigma factor [Lachnospiraceae bacterium]
MNKNVFAKIVLDATDSLYHISKSILQSDADCEDAVQEAIATAFAKLHTLKQEQYAKTWLTRILINECYNILRKQKKLVPLSDYEPEQEYETEDYSELYKALLRLKKEYRLTIVLYYLEGYSVKEIARIMRAGEGTVKSRMSRGRKLLKSILEEENAYEIIS